MKHTFVDVSFNIYQTLMLTKDFFMKQQLK